MWNISKNAAVFLASAFLLCLTACETSRLTTCDEYMLGTIESELAQIRCLSSRLEGESSGHAAFGLTRIHLRRFVGSDPAEEDRQAFLKYSSLARRGSFADDDIKEQVLTALGYFDALASLRSSNPGVDGEAWLDEVCPDSDVARRFRCHFDKLEYWASRAEDGSYEDNETMYLASLALREKYHHSAYRAVEIVALGFIDFEEATTEFDALLKAGDADSTIIFGYCDMLERKQVDATVEAEILKARCD